MKEVTINGTVYVPKTSLAEKDGMRYAVVRCHDAGVHAGYIAEHTPGSREVVLRDSRRLWSWRSSGSLSALAMYGPPDSKLDECKFAVVLPELLVADMCEIIYCTEAARRAIEGVPEWVLTA